MTDDKTKIQTIAEKLGYTSDMRSLNMSAYDMNIKIAIYSDGALNIVEGGHKHPDKLTELGFHVIDGEWVSMGAIHPRKIVPIFEEAFVEQRPVHEILIDRTDRKMPSEASEKPLDHTDRIRVAEMNAKVTKVVASSANAKFVDAPIFWFANAEFEGYTVQGFGSSPENAMKALVDTWGKVVARDWTNVEELANNRDSITISEVEMGKGHCMILLEGTEHTLIHGTNERFDEIISEMLPKRAEAPAPKM